MEKRENKINIKKIKSFKAFCGLDAIEMGEFEHYNIIFGNNGCGKTSLTRAFELLISKNKRIEKYRTILLLNPQALNLNAKMKAIQ